MNIPYVHITVFAASGDPSRVARHCTYACGIRIVFVGRGLKVPVVAMSPEEAAGHFGWLAAFAGLDLPASSAQTQARLGWRPTGPGLIADLEQMRYGA